MAQIGFYFDMTRCVNCKTCQMACKDKNNLDVGVNLRHAESFETGSFPIPQTFCYSFSCNHCATPACLASCTTGAIYKAEDDGTVIIDQELCIGCQACVSACPYSIPQLNTNTGQINKCDGCYFLRKNGEEPACASSCCARALHFGDLEELKSKQGAGKTLVNDFPALGAGPATGPSILINMKEAGKTANFEPSLF